MRKRSMAAIAAMITAFTLVLGASPQEAEAGWKWTNRNGDCVDTCSRDDCPCYNFQTDEEALQ